MLHGHMRTGQRDLDSLMIKINMLGALIVQHFGVFFSSLNLANASDVYISNN